jgi:hypothetical protein
MVVSSKDRSHEDGRAGPDDERARDGHGPDHVPRDRRVEHRLVVDDLDETQYFELARRCGEEHPGRFKPWARGSGSGFHFDCPDESLPAAVDLCASEGLSFVVETTITERYEP